MTKTQLIFIVATLSVSIISLSCAQQSDPEVLLAAKATKAGALSDAQFETIHRYIIGDESKWNKIQWRSDLWLAKIESAKKNKPLFIWAMNGDPLGCV